MNRSLGLNEKLHRFVSLGPPEEHGVEDWDLFIEVVVDDNAGFAFVFAQDSTDVLNELAAKGDGESKK